MPLIEACVGFHIQLVVVAYDRLATLGLACLPISHAAAHMDLVLGSMSNMIDGFRN